MKKSTIITPIFIMLSILSCKNVDNTKTKDTIVQIEKEALERWLNRDVYGYLDLFSENATYIDEGTKLKLNGLDTIKKYIEPWQGKIYVPRYEIIKPTVKLSGDFGILTYNLYNFNEQGDTILIWNCTELYEKIKKEWKISHSHWSIVRQK